MATSSISSVDALRSFLPAASAASFSPSPAPSPSPPTRSLSLTPGSTHRRPPTSPIQTDSLNVLQWRHQQRALLPQQQRHQHQQHQHWQQYQTPMPELHPQINSSPQVPLAVPGWYLPREPVAWTIPNSTQPAYDFNGGPTWSQGSDSGIATANGFSHLHSNNMQDRPAPSPAPTPAPHYSAGFCSSSLDHGRGGCGRGGHASPDIGALQQQQQWQHQQQQQQQ
eukprot:CAMPEP_0206586524 /NCGR_PEP_ID=MMETSP0325_2-20121206/37074_1 /ASSEMBLY_ACC=CAM_ASM_000347 /TAXON_ID=2866 /ORGANISM="Crypthecodinium cohnii, Strain Seligo" /LENGTH=223 /DNA_ID=CAMNT_0054094299 /DNA_START=54 /DNA_END=722 /DNA_ORIENTATION=+